MRTIESLMWEVDRAKGITVEYKPRRTLERKLMKLAIKLIKVVNNKARRGEKK